MTINSTYALTAICAMAAITLALRATPFVAARFLQRLPAIEWLGQFLPPAIMVLLLLHTLRDSAGKDTSAPWPEVLAAATVVLIQLKFRQPLVSIFAGTALYVFFRNISALA